MEEIYKQLQEIFKKSYSKVRYVFDDFSQTDKNIVDKILLLNQNEDEEWNRLFEKYKNNEAALYAFVYSDNTPIEIRNKATLSSHLPQTCLKALERDIRYEDKVYDHILKLAKNEIVEALKTSYTYTMNPLPFSQQAIDYYAKNKFDSSRMTKGPLLTFIAYTSNKDVIKHMLSAKSINEGRANYLINNPNIDSETRNKIFYGQLKNFTCDSVDWFQIINPTKEMAEEIYQSSIDGYCITKNNKKLKNDIKGIILSLIDQEKFTEGMEKDLIARYDPKSPDSNEYADIIKHLLKRTKNIGTIEYAKTLNSKIFDSALFNENISEKQFDEISEFHIQNLEKKIKKTKTLPANIYGVGNALNYAHIDESHFYELTKVKNPYINSLLVLSKQTPESCLRDIINQKTSYINDYANENIRLTAFINLELRKHDIPSKLLSKICNKFMYELSSYKDIKRYTIYGVLKEPYLELHKIGKTDILDDCLKDLQMTCDTKQEIRAIQNYLNFKKEWDKKIIQDDSPNLEEQTDGKLAQQQRNISLQYQQCNCIEELYPLLTKESVTKYLKIEEILTQREAKTKTKEFYEYEH